MAFENRVSDIAVRGQRSERCRFRIALNPEIGWNVETTILSTNIDCIDTRWHAKGARRPIVHNVLVGSVNFIDEVNVSLTSGFAMSLLNIFPQRDVVGKFKSMLLKR